MQTIEICAGAGGQALGLEQAGFAHLAAVEIDPAACNSLRLNRPDWPVLQMDVKEFDGRGSRGRVDLLAGGVPCPPFSVAGQQLGADDDRDLFPHMLRLAQEIRPRAILIENVRGFASSKFDAYREHVVQTLIDLDYPDPQWKVVYSADFGVPQLRPRFLLVALRSDCTRQFRWPDLAVQRTTVGEALLDMMSAGGWRGAHSWAGRADTIAPTLVGGSRKHGGADLGPSRARAQWRQLGVDGRALADTVPTQTDSLDHVPRLTIPMVAALQGFPDDWIFWGSKTAKYRQIGNAFPPPVAKHIGLAIAACLRE